MTNRSYFQFDTKSRLRRFFASSDGWSSLNKKIEITQEAGCDAEHYNQERYSGHGLSFCQGYCFIRPSIGEGSNERTAGASKKDQRGVLGF